MNRAFSPLLAVAVLPGVLRAQTDSNALVALGEAKAYNCGLNTAAFLLPWFDLPVDLAQLAAELDVGPRWEQATSLLLLKKTFEVRGLKVAAYKDATLDEAVAELGGHRVCLLHVSRGDDPRQGHFYLLVAAENGRVLLVDAGKNDEWIPAAELKVRFAKSFTGYYLAISPLTSAARKALESDGMRSWLRESYGAVGIPVVLNAQEGRRHLTIEELRGLGALLVEAAGRYLSTGEAAPLLANVEAVRRDRDARWQRYASRLGGQNTFDAEQKARWLAEADSPKWVSWRQQQLEQFRW
jgi:hypothetical protein